MCSFIIHISHLAFQIEILITESPQTGALTILNDREFVAALIIAGAALLIILMLLLIICLLIVCHRRKSKHWHGKFEGSY